jgi:hypothetical protein
MEVLRRAVKILNQAAALLEIDAPSRRIKKKFRKNLHRNRARTPSIPTILVEWPQVPSNMLSISLFLNSVDAFANHEIVGIRMADGGSFSEIKQRIKFRFSLFHTIGFSNLVYLNSNRSNLGHNQQISFPKSKDDVLKFSYGGISIGDLIYDTYLTRFQSATLNVQDKEFEKLVIEFCFYVDKLNELFSSRKINRVIVSHSVYHYGLLARTASKFGAEAFIVQIDSLFKLTSKFPHPVLSGEELNQIIKSLSPEELQAGIIDSRNKMDDRFQGNFSPELELSTGVAFSHEIENHQQVIKKNGRLNVLIATHDFFDAPHCYGEFFYPDFYCWLVRLEEISREKDFNWYIKVHPDARGAMQNLIEEIFGMNGDFTLLPRNISHHSLISQGIDVALTVHGTIGMEYPLLGIPVVNASQNNPHAGFDFCYTPASREAYEETIGNLEKFREYTYLDSPYLYHFVKHSLFVKSWIFKDFNSMLRDVGGYRNAMSNQIYDYFLNTSNVFDEKALIRIANDFLVSSERQVRAQTY